MQLLQKAELDSSFCTDNFCNLSGNDFVRFKVT